MFVNSKSLSMTFFVTISDTVFSITSKSMLEAVDFCIYDKIFLCEGFFLLHDFKWYIASNIFPSILLIYYINERLFCKYLAVVIMIITHP